MVDFYVLGIKLELGNVSGRRKVKLWIDKGGGMNFKLCCID